MTKCQESEIDTQCLMIHEGTSAQQRDRYNKYKCSTTTQVIVTLEMDITPRTWECCRFCYKLPTVMCIM